MLGISPEYAHRDRRGVPSALCYYTCEMACPYFYPLQARAQAGENARLPLGDSWAGICRAIPGDHWQPEETVVRPLCNLGYARGNCARFPEGDGPDAVRFAVSGDDSGCIRIYYVMERDHRPYAHGPLEYSRDAGILVPAPGDDTLTRQATAYLESYLRRKADVDTGNGR